jgi:hypothetical protein
MLALILVSAAKIHPRASQAARPAASPCSSTERRQFDFWVGDWDVFDVGGETRVARSKVEPILDGCVLLETYEGSDGHRGQSFTLFDANRKVWHQTWVTNRGELLAIEGVLESGQIVMTGDQVSSAEPRRVRGIWKPVEGGVRETALVSSDGGKTWRPWFDLMFRPHKP